MTTITHTFGELMGKLDDLRATEALSPGDACEFRFPARRDWQSGTVLVNGGSGYWVVNDETGAVCRGLYIEHVRAPGTNPWLS